VTVDGALPAELAARSTFIAWGPPAYTNRTRLLAAELGVEVRHIYSIRRRGALAGLVKYPYQAVVTVFHLLRHRPRLVLVQNPPSFAVIFVAVYAALSRAIFVVDAHSAAFDAKVWSRPEWVYRIVARGATTTIVTNDHFALRIRGWGGHASVIRDIPTQFECGSYPLPSSFNVAVVCTFADDEPIGEVVEAATTMPDVRFFVTGDPRREGARVPDTLPQNVEFTGFVAADEYYGLLRDSDAVMVLTTRNHTMQRGACEALSVGTPIVTSDWPLLRDYFCKGTIHVDNTAVGIERGLRDLRNHHERFQREVEELRAEVVDEWTRARDGLAQLMIERAHVSGR
jgi:glycosyltransferase involved in cell wall biosynthesis